MNRRRQAVLDFNRALWVLRAETPSTNEGLETLLHAIEVSLTVVFGLYEAGVPEAMFLEQMEESAMMIFDPKAQA